MFFPSLDFAVFFLAVFAASWSLAGSMGGRKALLTGASYFFYGYWDWRLMLLLAGSSLLNYWAGAALSLEHEVHRRRTIVAVAVFLNLLVLGLFKYYGFFIDSLADILKVLGIARDLPVLNIVLPIGISFFTFQGISYVVDVFRRDVAPAHSLLDLSLYISFFPQLVAGPIVRAGDFLPQLEAPPQLSKKLAVFGLTLITFGLFKKMVIAQTLADGIVDPVFANPWGYGGFDLVLGVYAYAVQIYCDFSGYSDIAIGTAALFGFRFLRNFNQPYRATSLRDFWRRWHISLSSWLRDYLYKPLGGNQRGAARTLRNIILAMFLGGLWHGAAWNFVLWGLFHGLAMVVERLLRALRMGRGNADLADFGGGIAGGLLKAGDWGHRGLTSLFGFLITFHLICFSWILFRTGDMETVQGYLEGLQRWGDPAHVATPFLTALVFLSLAAHFLPRDLPERIALALARFGLLAGSIVFALGLVIINSVAPHDVAPFIYFQF